MTQLKKLFEPGEIGNLKLKNRIIMAPMLTRFTTAEGGITDKMIDYYVERARGGCGLLTVESSCPSSGGYPGRIYVDSDKAIPGLKRLVDAVHDNGAKIVIEFNPHRGRSDEFDPATASECIHPKTGGKVRALSNAEIKKLVVEFGEGTRRAREAGFDGIMVHGGSGYLISEMLSPRINKRTDEYGGDSRNKARFSLELVAAAKAKAGAGYPVIYRMVADERVPGGFGIKDAIVLSKLLEEAGADAIDVTSGSVSDSFPWVIPYMYMHSGCNVDLSQLIKKEVKIPVSVAGKILDPDLAEEILREGRADFISLSRAVLADPQFVNKAKAGRTDDILRCVACLRCIETILKPPGAPVICTVNPAVGREKEFEAGLKPAARKKKLLVIGGGPGGMEAAIIAAQKGHKVTLWEKDDKLGGQLNLAVMPPGKEDMKSFVEYLKRRLDELKVTVELGKDITAKAALAFSPDAVIVAVGSTPFIPIIKGSKNRKVVTYRDVMSGKVVTGKRVIVIGGGFVGCELADLLAERGAKVTIIEILPQLASELYAPVAGIIIQKLREVGVESFTGVKEEGITARGIDIVDKDGNRISLEADDIVIATGTRADKTVFESFKGKVPELYEVGDCAKARRLHEAVLEGATASLKI